MPGQIHRLIAGASLSAQPVSALLELTYSCNWRCVFCFNPRHHDIQRLNVVEWEAVLDDLRTLGTMNLTLTGGEPLAHPQFFEIAGAARARGFALRIFTNGSLIDNDGAARIARLYPLSVETSLHGATADTHDRATARPGSFEQLLRGLRALQRYDVNIVVKTPVTSINEGEIEAMIELATSLGASYRLDPVLTPRDDGDRSPLNWAPSAAGLRRVIEIGLRTGTVKPVRRNEGSVNCGLGSISLAIDPEGNVFPCHQWRHAPIGNVRTTRLRELWPSSPVREQARTVAREANDMLVKRGGAAAIASFCPALAREITGDPLVPDAQFLKRAEVTAALLEGAPSRER